MDRYRYLYTCIATDMSVDLYAQEAHGPCDEEGAVVQAMQG